VGRFCGMFSVVPRFEAFNDQGSHGCWGMISCKVVLEIMECFVLGCLSTCAWASEHVCYIFFEVSAGKASSVNLIIDMGLLV
jgi:hypothetical protein